MIIRSLFVLSAVLIGAGSASALEVGTRHSSGTSYSRYSGTSRTDSHVNGSVTERSVSGSAAHGFNGSFGGRVMRETYGSTGRDRLNISGGSNSNFSETATFSR